jgi:hypothetical protein
MKQHKKTNEQKQYHSKIMMGKTHTKETKE